MRSYPEGSTKDIDKKEFESSINCVERHLGKVWLEKKTNLDNPIKKLWHSTDVYSSVELYLIGKAISKAEKNNQEDWIEDLVSKIKNARKINIVGLLYEGLVYLILNGKEQQLAPAGNEGYDITYSYSNDIKMYISCKKLMLSQEHEKHEKTFKSLSSFISNNVSTNTSNSHSYVVSLKNKNIKLSHLKHCLSLVTDKPESTYNFGSVIVRYSNVIDDNLPYSYDKFKASYQIILNVPHKNEERKRINNLIGSAYRNLKKHSKAEKGKSINAVFISLPDHVSLQLAKEWVRNSFKSNYSQLSFIVFTKFLPVNSPDADFLTIQYDIAFNDSCVNPLSGNDVPIKDWKRLFEIEFPLGMHSTKESKVVLTNLNLDVNQSYLFQKGEVNLVSNNILLMELESREGVKFIVRDEETQKILKIVEPLPMQFNVI
ncbi:hypothetical protein BTZ53_24640 [Vibrio parahaemolyticus]|uniref:hypothetical protein n=1 Tax=Vibrio parahaemolyticus TaxID=670 RepID=UPI000A36151A|nr:hypothetical protein [Vibrio parahaemolyticus]MBM4937200.1 hypothetical protein [Vibrio parahaemolyticus]OUJ38734.1 hypothetical protein BTZ53_24640 [Vibrio parahaemolyticus]